MEFVNPTWLWGLSALSIPISIHLLSRKQGNIIRFGSLRHLTDSSTARFSTLRLNEVLLLFLRCLLLTLIVFMLAELQFNGGEMGKKKWLLVEPGIETTSPFIILADSLQNKNFETRYFAPGFPSINESPGIGEDENYWLLIEELRAFQLDSVVIASHGLMRRFHGQRIDLPDNTRWVNFERPAESHIVSAIRQSNNQIQMRKVHTSATRTYLETIQNTKPVDETSVSVPDTITIAITADVEFEFDKKIIQAAIEAIASVTPHRMIVRSSASNEANTDPSIDWRIMLSETTSQAGEQTIAFVPCQDDNLPLLIRGNGAMPFCQPPGNHGWLLTRRLTEQVALEQQLPLLLAQILLPGEHSMEDNRVMPEQLQWSKSHGAWSSEAGAPARHDYLVIAVFLTLMAERIIAMKRNQ